MRWACCMGLGATEWCSMAAPGGVALLSLAHSERIAGARGRKGMGWSAAAEEEPVAADGVDERCSRVEVVGGDAEVEDPAARGGDDAA